LGQAPIRHGNFREIRLSTICHASEFFELSRGFSVDDQLLAGQDHHELSEVPRNFDLGIGKWREVRYKNFKFIYL